LPWFDGMLLTDLNTLPRELSSRFARLFRSPPAEVEFAEARGYNALAHTAHFVRRVYRQAGYILTNGRGNHIWQALSTRSAITYIGRVQRRIVASMTLILDSPEVHLPCERIFGPTIRTLRKSASLAEITNWAVSDAYRNTGTWAELSRRCFHRAVEAKRTDILATITARHEPFFEILGFRRVAGPRNYIESNDDPVLLMRLDCTAIADRARKLKTKSEELLRSFYLDNRTVR